MDWVVPVRLTAQAGPAPTLATSSGVRRRAERDGRRVINVGPVGLEPYSEPY